MCIIQSTIFLSFAIFLAQGLDGSYRSLFEGRTINAEEPLLLTPLIDAGKLDEARSRSRNPPLLGDVLSYSGFFTVNKTSESHLFFWYCPKAEINGTDTNAPLILWLNGGPGASSLYGLFLENGPVDVSSHGWKKRTHAWTNHYHMLYIDQPVGTGFSFTSADGYVKTEDEVADHLHEALSQFYKLFAEFRNRDFYIAGESFAGMYIPAIGFKIHSVNRQQLQDFKIPLKGMMIGNGFSDAETQYDYARSLHDLGMIDDGERSKLEEVQNLIIDRARSRDWSLMHSFDKFLLAEIQSILGEVSYYDYTKSVSFYRDLKRSLFDFVEQDGIGQIIHVGQRKFDERPDRVQNDFAQNVEGTVRPWVEELLEHYPILFYSGQLDLIVSHSTSENFLSSLRWSGASEYNNLARKQIWRVGKSVAGYYKVVKNLVYIVVRNAGHLVPLDQPENSLIMIDLFVNKQFKPLNKTI